MNYNYTDKILFDYLTENPDASVIQINRVTGVSFPLITDFLENKWRGGRGQTGAQGPTGPSGPSGPSGPTGPRGPGVTWQGPYTPEPTVYFQNDIVSYGGSSWICVVAQTTETPNIHSTAWQLLASVGNVGPKGLQGDTGAQGQTGAQGPTGPTGPRGPGVTWYGPYTQGTVYYLNDIVSYGGSSWICVVAQTTETPSIHSTAWQLLALVGNVGPTGAQGSQGVQGVPGDRGLQGDTGPQGPQGPQGATGAAGPGFSNGDAKGDIKYWDGTVWKNLAVGTTGQVLTVGENDDLEWTDK